MNSVENLVIFCKSYIKDIRRLKILKESVDKFNADNLSFYISVPKKDLEEMRKVIKTGNERYKINFVTDEQILNTDSITQNWTTQQVVKFMFYKLNLCRHYIMIDSDAYFITDFYARDFMFDDNTPYIPMQPGINFSRAKIYEYTMAPIFQKVKDILNSKGSQILWGGIPMVLSADVLSDFEQNFLIPNDYTFEKILSIAPSEFTWYGEWLLKTRKDKLQFQKLLFKNYYYNLEYLCDRKLYSVKDLIDYGYIGIVMQNGWVKKDIYKPSVFRKLHRVLYKYKCGLYLRRSVANSRFRDYFKTLIIEPLKELIV